MYNKPDTIYGAQKIKIIIWILYFCIANFYHKMPKNIRYSSLFIVFILIFSACQPRTSDKNKAEYDATSTDTLLYDLFSTDTTDAACTTKYKNCPNAKISYPVFTTPDASLNLYLNNEINKIVLFKTDSTLFSSVNDFLKKYFADNSDLKKQGNYDDESSAWNRVISVTVYDKIGKYISLEVYREIYEGGAHPNSSVMYKVYDLVERKQLKASELLNLNDSTLLSIGEQYFRKNNNITNTSSLTDAGYFIFGDSDDFEDGPDYGKFHFNDNFALTKDGVTFLYNSYEIGPYAVGSSEFTIPYKDIQSFLKLKIW